MSQSIAVLVLSVVLAQDVPQGRFVTANGAIPNTPFECFGVTNCDGVEGDTVPVTVLGTAIMEVSDQAIARGDPLTTDIYGRAALDGSQGSANKSAIALEAASAEGQFIEVFLK